MGQTQPAQGWAVGRQGLSGRCLERYPEWITNYPKHLCNRVTSCYSFFDVDHVKSFLLSLLQCCFCFMFCFFGLKSPGILGFPCSSAGKESARNAGDLGSIPGLGRSLGEGHGKPLQYSCLEDPMDRGAWRATVHRVAKSGT